MSIPASIEFLAKAGRAAPSADNSQPWRMSWDPQNARLLLSSTSRSSFPAGHPACLISVGSVAENIIQAAASSGLDLNMRQVAKLGNVHYEFRIPQADRAPTVLSDHPLFLRHTNRLRFASNPVEESILAGLNADRQGGARLVRIHRREEIVAVADCVREASEIRFQTRENHEWFHASLRFDPVAVARGDGLDVATLGLPPGGAAMLRALSNWRRMAFANRFGAYVVFARVEAAPIARAPAILAIVAPSTREATLDAGRLMQRVWIEINSTGLAVQPFYVVSELLHRLETGRLLSGSEARAQNVRNVLSTTLALRGETVHMFLRIGWPICEPHRSRRIPLEEIVSLDSSYQKGMNG